MKIILVQTQCKILYQDAKYESENKKNAGKIKVCL